MASPHEGGYDCLMEPSPDTDDYARGCYYEEATDALAQALQSLSALIRCPQEQRETDRILATWALVYDAAQLLAEKRGMMRRVARMLVWPPVCRWCENPLDAERPGGREQEFCSPACRQAAYRERTAGRPTAGPQGSGPTGLDPAVSS